jgi:UDP-N-acetylmuramoyl-tripeptide--D-alanyl-D-alanine ligase
MRAFSLAEVAEPMAASLQGPDCCFAGVTTDSRQIAAGQLFVALTGPNFDGHQFVALAAERGACAALVARGETYSVPSLQVEDTLRALGQLGRINRLQFDGPLLAITGSSGKTTVKNLLSAMLERLGPTLATAGNLNNEIGVPLTLLRLAPEHRYAVIEMGAARAGDIDYLCKLAQPGVGLLVNALPAHLQGFKSVDGVAQAKGEIFTALDNSGIAVINADSEYAPLWREMAADREQLEFGFDPGAQVWADEISQTADGGSQFRLLTPIGEVHARMRLPGRHSIANGLAAAAAALAVGADLPAIVYGLATVEPVPGRLFGAVAASGAEIIDDSYNANPGSVKAAIEVLAGRTGRRVLVMGAMAELGAGSAALHRDMGRYARELGVEEVWVVGEEAAPVAEGYGPTCQVCSDRDDLLARVADRFTAGDVVLVKGSRSAGMEAVVSGLLHTAGEDS